MEDKEGINITETLMDIKERLARIEANTGGITATDEKVEKALAMAKEHEHRINGLQKLIYTLYGLVGGTVGVTIFIYIVEKFI
ncbi:DNA primase [Liquorilactobacillus uvarum]|uniref:DNA primase n=1 Tax=Liquorilactobacillus uvarum TaxID=303240 RepID=UPI00288BA8FD|nr:DNA primase [Liquorilactobacillus uvarum]